MLQEKTKMVSLPIFPSKTNGFSRQQHVAPLKLRHVAAQFFLIFFYLRLKKKKKIIGVAESPFGPHGDGRTTSMALVGHPQGPK
jgi:hypothetical protein